LPGVLRVYDGQLAAPLTQANATLPWEWENVTSRKLGIFNALQHFPRITPFLWFDSNAEAAVGFYLTVFKNSRRLDVLRNIEDSRTPNGSILTIAFELDGQKFTALNGGPMFKFTEAISFVVRATPSRNIVLPNLCFHLAVVGSSPSSREDARVR
jgi:hypothetical protein